MCFVVLRMEDASSLSSEVHQVATAATLMAPDERQPAEGSKGSLQKNPRARHNATK